MKFLATIFFSWLLVFSASGQTPKSKVVSKTKASVEKTAVDTKKVGTKKKPTNLKVAGSDTAKNPSVRKPKPTSKNNPAAPNPTANSAKPGLANPKVQPLTSITNEDDAEAEFEKATAVAEGTERIKALKRFLKSFPGSKRFVDAVALVVTVESQLGNDRLAVGDIVGAVKFYKAGVNDSPKPLPDGLFNDTLSKFAANLYFRGARAEGVELAKAIEEKCDTSVSQLLNIATFYMSIENGSEAKRVSEAAIKIDPASSAAYQTLGLANRIDFLLDESASAYAKALELEPESLSARRGLAEMKRSLGKSEESVTLYREILAIDEGNLPARTGFILALFDAGKRTEAEIEMARSLDVNPSNVILQAGAAYWYAIHGEGDTALDLAQKAITTDPRFIWSHFALARGYLAKNNPVAAEKTLLAARRYGNFPSLEYEIALARVSAGFYRDAAEELAKSFSVKDGVVSTNLGGRVARGSTDFSELIGYERRASIFAPTSGDSRERSSGLIALLELKQELDRPEPRADVVAKATDDFVRGDDKMKVHRLIYAGTQLLGKKVALAKVIELAKAAPTILDSGLEVADPVSSTMASELYESRFFAFSRGEYLSVPFVGRQTLSAILRGRVEELSGWAYYQLEDPAQASIHLKRAVSVLPPDSAWWRSSTWRLGTSLLLEGKNADALEMYVRSYKSQPDALRYGAIEALYKRINGHTLGLENRIGPNPSAQTIGENVTQPSSQGLPAIPIAIAKTEPTPETTVRVEPKEVTQGLMPADLPKLSSEDAKISPTPEQIKPVATPDSAPTTVEVARNVAEEPKPSPSPTIAPDEPKPNVTPDPTPLTESVQPEKKVLVEPKIEPSPTVTPEALPSVVEPKPEGTPDGLKSPETKEAATTRLVDNTNGLFPPVVITIPPPVSGISKPSVTPTPSDTTQAIVTKPSPSPETLGEQPQPTKPSAEESKTEKISIPLDGRSRVIEGVPVNGVEIKPCTLTLDQENVTLQAGGAERAVVVRRIDDGDVDGLSAVSASPSDISVRREVIPGVKWTALFVLRSTGSKTGVFQVMFEAPCGKKEFLVRVQ